MPPTTANVEAEQGVLGGLLIAGDTGNEHVVPFVFEAFPAAAVADCHSGWIAPGTDRSLIRPERSQLFTTTPHQAIWESIRDLFNRGVGIDYTTVGDDLATRGLLAAVGGPDYLEALGEAITSTTYLVDYARIIADKWRMRESLRTMRSIYDDMGNGTALADALRAGVAALSALAEEHTRCPTMTFHQALATVDDPADVLIGNGRDIELLTRGNRYMLLAGAGGVGKSRIAMQLMMDMVTGNRCDWFGVPMPNRGDGFRALYVQAENRARRIRKDVEGYMRGSYLGEFVDMQALDRIVVTDADEATRYLRLDLDRAGNCPNASNLKALVREHRPDMVLIDPLAKFMGADSENDNAEVQRAIDRIMIAVGDGARSAGIRLPGVVIVHHGSASRESMLNAGSSEGKMGPRGATAIVNSAMTVVTLSAIDRDEGESEDAPVRVLMSFPKVNDSKAPAELVVRYDGNRYEHDGSFDLAAYRDKVRQSMGRKSLAKAKPSLQRAVELAHAAFAGRESNQMWRKDLQEHMANAGVCRSNTYGAVVALEEAGMLRVVKMSNRDMVMWNGKKETKE